LWLLSVLAKNHHHLPLTVGKNRNDDPVFSLSLCLSISISVTFLLLFFLAGKIMQPRRLSGSSPKQTQKETQPMTIWIVVAWRRGNTVEWFVNDWSIVPLFVVVANKYHGRRRRDSNNNDNDNNG
jgi:hypothetical protein